MAIARRLYLRHDYVRALQFLTIGVLAEDDPGEIH